MKAVLINIVLFIIIQFNVNAQNSISGKWTVTKVNIGDILIAENGEAKVADAFLATITDEKERAFTQGMLEGLGKGILNSEMHFLEEDVFKEINGKSKKEFIGTYKFNNKKGDLKVTRKEGSEKMSVLFTDANHIVLTKKDNKMGEMQLYLSKQN